jgi:hypothetical protein
MPAATSFMRRQRAQNPVAVLLFTKIRKGITAENSKRISDNLQNIRKHCFKVFRRNPE